MIRVEVFDDGVICSECGEFDAPFVRADLHWFAAHHLVNHARGGDIQKVTVPGPMPRKVTLTRQQIIDKLSNPLGVPVRNASDPCSQTIRTFDGPTAVAIADALVAASEAQQ